MRNNDDASRHSDVVQRPDVQSHSVPDPPRQMLCNLVMEKGQGLLDQPRRCKGLLLDRLPNAAYQYQISALYTALQHGLAKELRSAGHTQSRHRLHEQLTETLLIATPLDWNVALWAVESVALALEEGSNNDAWLADVIARCGLSDAHICRSLGIPGFDVNTSWKPIEEEWRTQTEHHKSTTMRGNSKKDWLDHLWMNLAKHFNEDYRGLGGVRKFYEAQSADKRRIARTICNNVENCLRISERSIEDIQILLDEFTYYISTKSTEKIINDINEKLKKHNEETKENFKNWESIRRSIPRKRNELFVYQANIFQEMYEYRTWIEAWKFAEELLQELQAELTQLKNTFKNS